MVRLQRRFPSLLVSLPLLAVLVAGCSVASARANTSAGSASSRPVQPVPAEASAEQGSTTAGLPRLVRTNAEGGVEVTATPERSTGDRIVFSVQLTTHTGDLSYDMTKIAALRDDAGRTYAVEGWQGNMGGHHVQGELTFKAQPGTTPKWLELSLSGIDDIPVRSFRWDTR